MIDKLVREKIQYDYELMSDDEFVKCPHCGVLIEKHWNVFDGKCCCPKCFHVFKCEDE